MGPAGAVGVSEDALSNDGGVGSVGTVKGDTLPVDELVTGVDSGEPHSVMIVNSPRVSFRDTAESGVEANGESFLSDVYVRIERTRLDLVGPEEMVSEVHHLVGRGSLFGFLFVKLRNSAWEIIEIAVFDLAELRGVMLFKIFLADVVNDVVFLTGRELRHGHHHAVSLGDSLIHAEGVVSVLKFSFVEFESDGNGSFLFVGAVTGDTELIIDFLAALERVFVPGSNDFAMVGGFERLHPGFVDCDTFVFL